MIIIPVLSPEPAVVKSSGRFVTVLVFSYFLLILILILMFILAFTVKNVCLLYLNKVSNFIV